jgi:hypothetical protein
MYTGQSYTGTGTHHAEDPSATQYSAQLDYAFTRNHIESDKRKIQSNNK